MTMKHYTLLLFTLLLVGCGQTPEQIKANAEAEAMRRQQIQIEQEARHRRELEKIEAMGGENYAAEEAAKAKASDMTLGEGIGTAAAVGAGAWVFTKMIDSL